MNFRFLMKFVYSASVPALLCIEFRSELDFHLNGFCNKYKINVQIKDKMFSYQRQISMPFIRMDNDNSLLLDFWADDQVNVIYELFAFSFLIRIQKCKRDIFST